MRAEPTQPGAGPEHPRTAAQGILRSIRTRKPLSKTGFRILMIWADELPGVDQNAPKTLPRGQRVHHGRHLHEVGPRADDVEHSEVPEH